MTDGSDNPASEDHWFFNRREAIRYVIAQIVFASSLGGFFLFGLVAEQVGGPVALGVVVGVVLFAGWCGSIIAFHRSHSYWYPWWTRVGKVNVWPFSRLIFKDAVSVAGWGRGWVLARDLVWVGVVAMLVIVGFVFGVTVRTWDNP